jgi:hypothetical protein
VLRRVLVIALVATTAACDTDEATPSVSQVLATAAPPDTGPAPGSCTPSPDHPPVPTIEVGDSATDATLGTSSDPCDALTGEGYLDFNYNPVLIDASDKIRVIVGDTEATIKWELGEPFTEIKSGTWESAQPTKGCARLTIGLVSGQATATYGADIRVGGTKVGCPQRLIDPTDLGASDTTPPPTTTPSTDTTDQTNATDQTATS